MKINNGVFSTHQQLQGWCPKGEDAWTHRSRVFPGGSRGRLMLYLGDAFKKGTPPKTSPLSALAIAKIKVFTRIYARYLQHLAR
jgi:hypothetical protein